MVATGKNMEKHTLKDLLTAIRPLARRAGEAILSCRDDEDSAVQCKPDGSPLTAADLEAHRIIAEGLAMLDNSIPLISEEDDRRVDTPAPNLLWLVDPLDGTLGYLRGDGQFTVNIALVERGEAVGGVIFAPASDCLYYAAQGQGSFRESSDGKISELGIIQSDGELTAALTNTSHSTQMNDFLRINGISGTFKSSSSLKICHVAERRADIYPRFGRTALWDTAAGAIVAREAGCRIDDLEGRPLRFDPSEGIFHHGFMVFNPARIRQPELPAGWQRL
jgi:3'(2'), 5'-bisphosphate nucleotidase